MPRKVQAQLQLIIEDLTGQTIPLPGRKVPLSAAKLLSSRRSKGFGYSQFNEILLYLGYDRVSHAFFQYLVNRTTEYKSRASLKTLKQFRNGVDDFRKVALLFFGNVKFAFKKLSRNASFLDVHLARFDKRRVKNLKDRHDQVLPPEVIPGEDTYYLGYVVRDELHARLKKRPNDRAAQAEEAKRVKLVDRGKRNHDSYLASDHLDVYIATSMRERHEFVMVHETAKRIFSHPALRQLKLRYFDPTQAYCFDRIDKGLAEGLMLKRAACTIYFAQESDTFGKDSELASTLAQGKPVIAYVPAPDKNAAQKLVDSIVAGGTELRRAILQQLQVYEPGAAWKDPEVKEWLNKVASFDPAKGIERLQSAMKKHFENRDRLLRDVHPLGIQVNLKEGVANGVIIANTVDQCAKLVRGMMLRELQFDLETKAMNGGKYIYLKERISQSIFRVVTGDTMLTNAFWNFYLNPAE